MNRLASTALIAVFFASSLQAQVERLPGENYYDYNQREQSYLQHKDRKRAKLEKQDAIKKIERDRQEAIAFDEKQKLEAERWEREDAERKRRWQLEDAESRRILEEEVAERERREAERERREAERIASEVSARKGLGVGEWDVITSLDPIYDTPDVVAFLQSNAKTSLNGSYAELVVRCAGGSTSIYINWGGIVDDDEVLVTYRFNQEKAVANIWRVSTDYRATFAPGEAKSFALALMIVDRFVARVTSRSGNPATVVFETRGLTDAIQPVRVACNW